MSCFFMYFFLNVKFCPVAFLLQFANRKIAIYVMCLSFLFLIVFFPHDIFVLRLLDMFKTCSVIFFPNPVFAFF
jgi:hypothetical protein